MNTHSSRVFNLDSIPSDINVQKEVTTDAHLSYHCQSFQGFRVLDLVEGDALESGVIPNNHFVFLLEGEAEVALNGAEPLHMADGQMMLATLNMSLHMRCCDTCRVMIHTFSALLPECEAQVNSMYKLNCNYKEQHQPILPLHPLIRQFGQNVYELVKYGKMTPWMTHLKRLEIFSLISITNDVDNVLSFFYPLLNKQYSFRSMVMSKSVQGCTVDDLIKESGLCRTNFYRRFKREFGMPAKKWLQMKRAFAVRETAGFPGMNVKTLMSTHGFLSSNNFLQFCMTYFGCTPSELISDVKNGCMPQVRQVIK